MPQRSTENPLQPPEALLTNNRNLSYVAPSCDMSYRRIAGTLPRSHRGNFVQRDNRTPPLRASRSLSRVTFSVTSLVRQVGPKYVQPPFQHTIKLRACTHFTMSTHLPLLKHLENKRRTNEMLIHLYSVHP